MNPQNRILRLRDVMARTGLSKSTIYVEIAAGKFPEPVRLSERTSGWFEHEVAAWIDARPRARFLDVPDTQRRAA